MGVTHLDAGVVIGYLNATDAHHESAVETLARAQQERDRLAIASSALAECLVAPARTGADAVAMVRTVLDRLGVDVVNLTPAIAEAAAHLRANHRTLRLPDALVVATAAVQAADRLVTTDRGWPTATQMHVDFELVEL